MASYWGGEQHLRHVSARGKGGRRWGKAEDFKEDVIYGWSLKRNQSTFNWFNNSTLNDLNDLTNLSRFSYYYYCILSAKSVYTACHTHWLIHFNWLNHLGNICFTWKSWCSKNILRIICRNFKTVPYSSCGEHFSKTQIYRLHCSSAHHLLYVLLAILAQKIN